MKKHILTTLAFLIYLITFAQNTKPQDVVDINPVYVSKTTSNGIEIICTFKLDIKKGWHINGNQPLEQNLIATVLKFDESSPFTVQKITYPTAENMKLEMLSENEMALYLDQISITAVLNIAKENIKNINEIKGKIKYQPCNDQMCLFPVDKAFSLKVNLK